jgi:hypothetical protein
MEGTREKECETGSYSSGLGPVIGSCELGKEVLGIIKD